MVLQTLFKRPRGRPRKETIQQRAEGDSPLWAIVDQLTLIHDDLNRLVKMATKYEQVETAPLPPDTLR